MFEVTTVYRTCEEEVAMMKYLSLALTLAVVESCVQNPLPPEPPITVVISQCQGWHDAGEPTNVPDPSPRRQHALR